MPPSFINHRVVIDTNVVFERLTKQGGASGLIIDAWRAAIANAYISNALAYEYADVLSRKLSARRWDEIKPVLGYLLEKARFTSIYYTWRPSSPAPGDEHIIDCAMNAGASVVTPSDEVTEALAARDTVEPEAELKSEAVKRLRTRIKDAGKTR